MKNLKRIIIVLFVVIIYQFFGSKFEEKINVEINEKVEYIKYEDTRKSINNIEFDDINYVTISKNKFYRILEYKEKMGAIQTIDELINLERFTKNDIDKLKSFYIDEKQKVQYKGVNINNASKKMMKFLGLSSESIEKVVKYRNKKTIDNLVELQDIINEDIEKLNGAIYFSDVRGNE